MIYLDNKTHIFTSKGLIRAGQLEPNTIVKNYKNKIQKIDTVNRRIVKGLNITLENGEVFFLSAKNRVISLNDKILVEELSIGDFIGFITNNYFSPTENKEIDWYDELRTNSTPIRVPSKMDLLFAYWFGVYTAKGTTDSSGHIFIDVTKNEELFEYLVVITKEVFDVTPDKFKHKDGRVFAMLYSKNVSRFLKDQLGSNRFKKIPKLIQEASLEEQKAFVAGVSYKAYQEKGLIIYSSSSFLFIDYLSAILKNLGFIISKKKTKSGNNRNVYYLKIIGKTRKIDFPLEDILKINNNIDFSLIKDKFMIKTPNLIDVKVKSNNPGYESFKKYRRNSNEKIISNHIVKMWNIAYDSSIYYLKIKKIEPIEKDCVAISLSSEDGIVSENLIILE